MALVDPDRCGMCKRPFDPPRVVKWGEIGIDMKSILGPWDRLDDSVDTRVTVPVCGQCWEPLYGDISGISVHPNDIPLLGPQKPLERLPDGSAGLLGIPVYADESVERGKVELRYRGKTAAEVCAQYERAMDYLNPKR